jgi:hypothetical protein
MKKLALFFMLIIAAIVGFHQALQNGAFLRYLDEHPNPLAVPPIEYYVGGGYYAFHELQQAATYYIRIPMRYPASPYADDAYWEYLQTLDDSTETSRAVLAEAYGKYLELFPKGAHLENVRNKIDAYKSGAR